MLVLPTSPEESVLFRHRIGRRLLALHSDQLPGGAIFSHEDAGMAARSNSPPGVETVDYVVLVEHALHASPWIVALRPSCSRAHHGSWLGARRAHARP